VHDGSRLDDDEDVTPARPRPGERDPEEPVGPVERRARAATLENGKLLAEGEILEGERAAGSERGPGCGKYGQQEREHRSDLSGRATTRPPRKRQGSLTDRVLANDNRSDLSVRATPRPPMKPQRSLTDRVLANDTQSVNPLAAATLSVQSPTSILCVLAISSSDCRERLGQRTQRTLPAVPTFAV
jgi:hypothetical protein